MSKLSFGEGYSSVLTSKPQPKFSLRLTGASSRCQHRDSVVYGHSEPLQTCLTSQTTVEATFHAGESIAAASASPNVAFKFVSGLHPSYYRPVPACFPAGHGLWQVAPSFMTPFPFHYSHVFHYGSGHSVRPEIPVNRDRAELAAANDLAPFPRGTVLQAPACRDGTQTHKG
jgi:hypothetical protein